MIDALAILRHFYPEDDPLRRLLVRHSEQVALKALAIGCASGVKLDLELVYAGAMLHDVGIGQCNAPSILCTGTEPYLTHGILGAAMLREFAPDGTLDPFARICERHIGSGLTAAEIRKEHLPLPERDYLPETPEERLICLADKFYSKSGDMLEKPMAKAVRSMAKFGAGPLARFEALCREFRLSGDGDFSRTF